MINKLNIIFYENKSDEIMELWNRIDFVKHMIYFVLEYALKISNI